MPDDTTDHNSTSQETERICYAPTEELRVVTSESGNATVLGMVIPYNQPSTDLGGYREVILPGAFTESLSSGDEIRADVEHNPANLLARSTQSTLRLQDRSDGLWAEIDLPDTTLGEDTRKEVASKLRDAMSASWLRDSVISKFVRRGGEIMKEVSKAELRSVSLTAFPAYKQTAGSLALRCLAEFITEEVKTHVAQLRQKGVPEDKSTQLTQLRRKLDLLELSIN